MDPVRLGVIGCGAIGRVHVQYAQRSPTAVDVVAVCDVRLDAAEEVAAKFGVQGAYASAEALLADPRVEAVLIATPTCHRLELALKALALGKHVLLEKPVAMNAGELRQLIGARQARVVGCCLSRHRFLQHVPVAAEMVADGMLGPLRVVRGRAIVPAGEPPKTVPPPWRLSRAMNGGGVLVNWGSYDLDYLLGICGWSLSPRVVLARTWGLGPQFTGRVHPDSDAETHGIALVLCDGGEVISLERAEQAAAERDVGWQIMGTNGSLRLDMIPGEGVALVHDDTTSAQGLVSRTVWTGDESWDMAHAGPLLDFAEAIRFGRQPKTTLEQALLVQEIIDAIYDSAESGAAVSIG